MIMKGMRKSIAVLSPLLLILFAFQIVTAENIGEMKLIPEKNVVYAGDIFTVDIYINASDVIKFAETSISFNASLLEAISVENGDLFTIWLDDLVPGGTIQIDNINGTIRHIMGSSPPDSAQNEGIFARITFKAKNASGITNLEFIENETSFVVGNQAYNASQFILYTAQIIVNPVDVTVEPTKKLIGNETLAVNITVNPHNQTMAGVSCILHFNPNVLQVINFEYSDLFATNIGENTLINNTAGKAGPIAVVDLEGVNESGTIITIYFQPVATGYSYLNLTNVEVKDLDNKDMAFFATNSTVEVDLTPPTVDFEIGQPYYTDGINNYITSSTPLYINASDAHNYTIHYRINNETEEIGDMNQNVVLFLNNYTDGAYTIEYWAIDELGNEAIHQSIDVYLDNTSPETSAVLTPAQPNGENGWYISNVSLVLTANDTGSGVNTIYYKINDGEWNEYNESLSFTEEGIYIIHYYAVDNLGNSEAEKSIEIKIDKTAPTLDYNITGEEGDNGWYIGNVILQLIAEDAPAGIQEFKYRINNGEWQIYNESIEISEDGVYVIDFYAKDYAGNNASIEITIKIDKTPPSATHTLQGTYEEGKYTTDVKVTLTATDNKAGVKEIRYRLDGTSYTITGASGSFTVSAEGVHIIEYYAVDNAGNTGAKKQVSFTIEKNKKPIADFTYTPQQPTDLDTITFADASNDPDGSIVSWLWDFGDGNTSTEQNPTHKYADNGTYVVKLTVTDDKGATSYTTKIIEVANVPPTVAITYEPGKPEVKKEIKFKAIATDDDGYIVNYTWDFGDGNTSYGKNVTHVYMKEGNYTVKLIVKDNDGATTEKTIYVNVIKPTMVWWPYVLALIILIIIAIIVVAVWKKRQK